MGTFSSRFSLYRSPRWLVIWASFLLALAPWATAQTPRTAKKNKGPRALGLLELAPNGKARLIPIEILYDGQYYDAGAYKASPVPIALWSGTVYEGFLTGVSQGLFTVAGALENPETKEWLAEGTWLPAGAIAAKSGKKPVSTEPRGLNDDSGPPVLRRTPAAPANAPEAPSPPAPQTAPEAAPAPSAPSPTPAATPAQAPSANTPATPPAPATPPQAASPNPPASAAAPEAAAAPPTPEDPNRPTLKRGKPTAKPSEPFFPPAATSPPGANSPQPSAKSHAESAAAKATPLQLIPAISDANGPEPQSYKYEMKPDEENQLRAKALAMAGDEVNAWAKQLAGATGASPTTAAKAGQRGRAGASHPPQPQFTDVRFRAFDLSNSNEPILVLTAAARLPQNPRDKAEPSPQTEVFVALVARQDSNGDFHKVLSNVTDANHLDVAARMEFIDAVDADGDGRGELLFRQVSDSGSSFVVYRVIGDQVWTLFQGTPGA